MVTIIHGDDISSSRKYFIEEKQKASNPVNIEGEKVILNTLVQAIEGGELFSTEKKIFIENFFSKKKTGKEYDEIITYLKKNQPSADIYFWDNKELSKTIVKTFSTADIKIFKLPQTLFLLLDSIRPNNGKSLIDLFQKTLLNAEAELVFFMLIRQFRFLLAVSDLKQNEPIDEVKRLAPWQLGKLQKQAGLFSPEELKKYYKKLYQIDLAQKTGALTMPLNQTLDFFFLDI